MLCGLVKKELKILHNMLKLRIPQAKFLTSELTYLLGAMESNNLLYKVVYQATKLVYRTKFLKLKLYSNNSNEPIFYKKAFTIYCNCSNDLLER